MGQQDYSIKELIQMETCTNCCLCADVCPAVAATKDGQLSGIYRLFDHIAVFTAHFNQHIRIGRCESRQQPWQYASRIVFRRTEADNVF